MKTINTQSKCTHEAFGIDHTEYSSLVRLMTATLFDYLITPMAIDSRKYGQAVHEILEKYTMDYDPLILGYAFRDAEVNAIKAFETVRDQEEQYIEPRTSMEDAFQDAFQEVISSITSHDKTPPQSKNKPTKKKGSTIH